MQLVPSVFAPPVKDTKGTQQQSPLFFSAENPRPFTIRERRQAV